MTPRRAGPLAYWPSGGEVMSQRGPLAPGRALGLIGFLGGQAAACRTAHDAGGARYCANAVLELARAIVATDDWNRAAGAGQPQTVSLEALRSFIRDLSRRPYS